MICECMPYINLSINIIPSAIIGQLHGSQEDDVIYYFRWQQSVNGNSNSENI